MFGEKGSGKSSLRLTMRRHLEAFNESRTGKDGLIFTTEYVDFDGLLEQFRRSTGAGGDPGAVAKRVRERWATADHLDAILSGGVTRLVDEFLGMARTLQERGVALAPQGRVAHSIVPCRNQRRRRRSK